VLYALEMLEGVRHVLLCMLEAVEGELSFRDSKFPVAVFSLQSALFIRQT
jgi:hypothetical protein